MRFRLQTLMIVVTLFCAACAYVGWQAKIVRERKAWRANPLFCDVSDRYQTGGLISWLRRALGDSESLRIIADDAVSDADLDSCRTAFPEADVRRDREQPITTELPSMKTHIQRGTLTIWRCEVYGEELVYMGPPLHRPY